MMKIGRMSAPGTSSNNDTIPTQRNITRQAIIPTMSRRSPTIGRSRIVTIYSLMSSTIQTMRKSNSSSVKMKYLGKDLNSLSCCPKGLSSYNSTNVLLKTSIGSVKYIYVLVTV